MLNVRLGAEEEKIVRGLRRARVNVSELVRRAIRENAPRAKGDDPVADILDIIRAHPDDGPGERRPALDDRRAMSSAIRRHLRKKTKR